MNCSGGLFFASFVHSPWVRGGKEGGAEGEWEGEGRENGAERRTPSQATRLSRQAERRASVAEPIKPWRIAEESDERRFLRALPLGRIFLVATGSRAAPLRLPLTQPRVGAFFPRPLTRIPGHETYLSAP